MVGVTSASVNGWRRELPDLAALTLLR
jgi:hypothetical protein